MSSSVIEQFRIREENIVREEIASHPLFRDVQAVVNIDGIAEYTLALKDLLRQSPELSRSTQGDLFRLCDKSSSTLGLDINLRLFKSRGAGGTENARVHAHERDVLLVFEDGIAGAMDDRSLLATIGHELGHYAFGHISDVVSWSIVGLHNKIADLDEGLVEDKKVAKELARLRGDAGWDELVVLLHLLRQIGELNADRAGLVSVQEFDACVRGFMILSGGPADRFGTYDPANYLAQARELVAAGDIFDETDWFASHPLPPLRVLALEYFRDSDVYRDLTGAGSGKNRLTEFSKLLPSIVPMEILGDLPARTRPNVGATSGPAMHQASSMADVELNMLVYMCCAQVIGADGKTTPAERTFLEQQVRPLAALEDMHRALDQVPDDRLSMELDRLLAKARALPARTKGALVKRMVKAAKADRRVVQEEIDRIRELANSFGAAEQADREIGNVWGR